MTTLDLDALEKQLNGLGNVPHVDDHTMLILDDGEVRPFRASDGRSRGLDVRQTVTDEPAWLYELPAAFGDGLHVVYAVVVPQVTVDAGDN